MSTYTPIALSFIALKPILDGNQALTDFEVACALTVRDELGNTIEVQTTASAFTGVDPAQIDAASQLFAAVYQRLKVNYGIA